MSFYPVIDHISYSLKICHVVVDILWYYDSCEVSLETPLQQSSHAGEGKSLFSLRYLRWFGCLRTESRIHGRETRSCFRGLQYNVSRSYKSVGEALYI